MENLETKLIDLIDKLEAGGTELAPEVVEAALTAVFIDGLRTAVVIIAALILGFLLIQSGVKHARRNAEDWEIAIRFVPGIPLCMVGTIGLLAENPWLAIFAPEAALVKQLLL